MKLATHSGVMQFSGGRPMPVHVLEDGEPIIEAICIDEAFGPASGELVAFPGALSALGSTVEFCVDGEVRRGYPTDRLPDLCDAIIGTPDGGLTWKQKQLKEVAWRLLRMLARRGFQELAR